MCWVRKKTCGLERVNNLPKIFKFLCHRSDDSLIFSMQTHSLSAPEAGSQGQSAACSTSPQDPLMADSSPLGGPWLCPEPLEDSRPQVTWFINLAKSGKFGSQRCCGYHGTFPRLLSM